MQRFVPRWSSACSVSAAASLCYKHALTVGDIRALQCQNKRLTSLYRRCPTPLTSCSPPFKCFRDTASSRCLSSYKPASACISGFARSLVGLVALINGTHCPLGAFLWHLPNVWLATVCSPVERAPHRRQPFSLWCLSSNLLRLFDSEQPTDSGRATVAGVGETLQHTVCPPFEVRHQSKFSVELHMPPKHACKQVQLPSCVIWHCAAELWPHDRP